MEVEGKSDAEIYRCTIKSELEALHIRTDGCLLEKLWPEPRTIGSARNVLIESKRLDPTCGYKTIWYKCNTSRKTHIHTHTHTHTYIYIYIMLYPNSVVFIPDDSCFSAFQTDLYVNVSMLQLL